MAMKPIVSISQIFTFSTIQDHVQNRGMYIEIQTIKRYRLMAILCRLGYKVHNGKLLIHKFQLKLYLFIYLFVFLSI